MREDQSRRAQEELEAKLLEGLASGAAIPLNTEEFKKIREEVQKRLGGHRKRGK